MTPAALRFAAAPWLRKGADAIADVLVGGQEVIFYDRILAGAVVLLDVD